MDQGSSAPMSTGSAPPPSQAGRRGSQASPVGDGIADKLEAVEAARQRLGRNLDRLTTETQAQIGTTVEKLVWKAAAASAGVVAGLAVRKSLEAGWRKARKADPPRNPAAPGVGWGDALAWTVAMGVAMGVARLVAARGAAAGWYKATGTLPPDQRKR